MVAVVVCRPCPLSVAVAVCVRPHPLSVVLWLPCTIVVVMALTSFVDRHPSRSEDREVGCWQVTAVDARCHDDEMGNVAATKGNNNNLI